MGGAPAPRVRRPTAWGGKRAERGQRGDRLVRGPRLITRLLARLVLTVVGLAVVGVGIPLIPLPGPGWAVVFVGLGILSTQWPFLRRPIRWLGDVVTDTPPLLLGAAIAVGGLAVWFVPLPFELRGRGLTGMTTTTVGVVVMPFQHPRLHGSWLRLTDWGQRVFGRSPERPARPRSEGPEGGGSAGAPEVPSEPT